MALIAVFWAYDGWVYITWVSGEVKDPRRNVPRAMVLGVVAVGVIYMAMNLTYIYAMPSSEISRSTKPSRTPPQLLCFLRDAAMWLSALIALSCFGAMASCTLSRRARLFRHGPRWRLLSKGWRRSIPNGGLLRSA